MPKTLTWLATIIRVSIAPVLVGMLFLLIERRFVHWAGR